MTSTRHVTLRVRVQYMHSTKEPEQTRKWMNSWLCFVSTSPEHITLQWQVQVTMVGDELQHFPVIPGTRVAQSTHPVFVILEMCNNWHKCEFDKILCVTTCVGFSRDQKFTGDREGSVTPWHLPLEPYTKSTQPVDTRPQVAGENKKQSTQDIKEWS